jgi:putative endonuclease
LTYIFAVRKGGAIAHPDSYREVEQWTENPCVPVPIAIGTIPGGDGRKNNHTLFWLSFMSYFCYILFSKSINRYYIGYTSDINERLKLHKSGHFGGKSYTNKTSDWDVYLLIPCKSIEQAIFIELWIKKMKSRKYIENLKKHPEMLEKILNEFNDKSSK